MKIVTEEGLIKEFGFCALVIGIFILAEIAILTHVYVGYYSELEQVLAARIGPIWLRLIFEPVSGVFMGTTLSILGMGMLRLRNWARVIALALMCINFFNLGCWIFFTGFQYISAIRFTEILAIFILITIFLNLKWVKAALK